MKLTVTTPARGRLDAASLGPAQPREAPLHNLDGGVLFERLVSEYVFGLLTEATIESIVSENAARFAAMEAAHDNVSKRLSQLRQAAHQQQQSEITAEFLDLITGAETLSGIGGSARPSSSAR